MNLLYTTTAYPPSVGGAQLLHHHTAIHLANRHQVQVVSQWNANRSDWLLGTTLRAPESSHDYVIDGVPAHRIGQSRQEKVRQLPAIGLYYLMMESALKIISPILEAKLDPFASEADLIHNIRIGREGLSMASLRTARSHAIPFVLTPVHHPRWTGWRYRVFLDIYREADAVIALTHAEKRILRNLGVEHDRIYVTGFGPILAEAADPEAFLSRHEIDGPLILFLGQHYPYKGFAQLLQATQEVWDKFPTAMFAFVGRAVGTSEQVFEKFNDPRILRLGEVDLQAKTNALAACTLLCVPSTQESFGGVYTEAWSFSKPVIGCDIPAVSEVITDKRDGLLVSQEPDQIAGAIIQVLSSSTMAAEMGEAGRQKLQERYNWERLATLTEEVYFHVTGSQA